MAPFWAQGLVQLHGWDFHVACPALTCRIVNHPSPFLCRHDKCSSSHSYSELSQQSNHGVFNGGIWQGLLLIPDLGTGCVPSQRFQVLELLNLGLRQQVNRKGSLTSLPLAGAPHLHFALSSANGRLRRELSFTCPRRKPLNMDMAKKQVTRGRVLICFYLKKKKKQDDYDKM